MAAVKNDRVLKCVDEVNLSLMFEFEKYRNQNMCCSSKK